MYVTSNFSDVLEPLFAPLYFRDHIWPEMKKSGESNYKKCYKRWIDSLPEPEE